MLTANKNQPDFNELKHLVAAQTYKKQNVTRLQGDNSYSESNLNWGCHNSKLVS